MLCKYLLGRTKVFTAIVLCYFSCHAIAESDTPQKQTVIEQISKITESLPEKPGHDSTDKEWDNWRKKNFEVRGIRIAAIDRLKKFKLSEKELRPYLVTQVDDIEDCFYHQRSLPNKYEGILYGMMDSKSATERTLATELFWSLNIYHVNTHLMHLSEQDVQQIADFEISRRDHPEAGRLMAKAINLANLTEDMKIKWSTWVLEKMPAQSEGHKLILARNSSKTDIGKVVNFKGVDVEGNAVDSKSFTGKVVLVEYWAFWCGFCLQEIPEIKAVYDEYYDEGFRVVGVFNDYKFDELKKYLKDKKIEWPQMIEPTASRSSYYHPLAKRYGITSLPSYLLIDRNGKLVKAGSGRIELLKPMIKKLLNEAGK